MRNPFRRAPRVRLPFTISLFWLVLGVAATLAILLWYVVSTATGTTEDYVVYRERIDMRDDAARAGNELMDDIRRLQADVLRLATAVEAAVRPAEAKRLVETTEFEHQLVPDRSYYVEVGTFRRAEPSTTEPAADPPVPDRPTGVDPFHRVAAGDVILDAFPDAEWARLDDLGPNRVVTLAPQAVNVNLSEPTGGPDDGRSPAVAAPGPHWLLCSVCRVSGGEPGAFCYAVLSLNPRLESFADDPRHLTFLAHGEDGTHGRQLHRWMLHPDRGHLFADPRSAAFGGEFRNQETFVGQGDESLVRSALEQFDRKKDDPRTRRVGVVLEGELDHLMLNADHELYYAQSEQVENVRRLVENDRPYRTSDLFVLRGDVARVKAADLTREIPQFRILAGTLEDLGTAQSVIKSEVDKRLGSGAVVWKPSVKLDDYSFHVNALSYDPADESRYLTLLQGVSAEEIKHEVAGAVWDLWFMVYCGIALLAVVAVLLGDATRRLNRLSRHAFDLSEGDPASAAWTARLPELESKFRTDRGDEVGVLGNTLAGLVGRLRTANADLELANAALENEKRNLERIVDERTESYEAERDRAEKARRDLNDYVSKVNHEINNPLTILKSWADRLWRAAANGDPSTRQSLGYIRSAAALIEQQVNDLGVATQIGHGDGADFKLDPKAINLAHLIRDTVELMQSRAEKNRNVLTAELDPRIERGEVAFESDERRVRQILMNLIGNACKFTEEGRVTVRARVSPKGNRDWLRVEVEDTGFGMTQEQRARLFKEYERSTDAEGNESGTGLGLCVSRHLARRLGGDLDVYRTELGRGTSFLLELPLLGAEPKKPEPASGNGRPEAEPARAKVAALGLADVGRGREVLVVDDEADVRALIREHLVARGFVVHTADTAEQALRLARERRPHAITLDVLLPGGRMNGWDVLAALKADEATADIPVVMVTILDDRSHGFALGAADFLSKPIDLDRLADRVQTYCREESPGRALVVEDDPGQRQAIAERLREDGWEVDQAADGLLGLSAARRRPPDLILLDLAMPQMDGIEFAERLGREPRLAEIPIIVLTGRTLSREERDRLNRRVEAILEKGTSDADAALERVLDRVSAARHDRPAAAAGGAR